MKNNKLIIVFVFFTVNIVDASVADIIPESYSKAFEFKFDIPVDQFDTIVSENNEMFRLAYPRGWYAINYLQNFDLGIVSNSQDICNQLFELYKYSAPSLDLSDIKKTEAKIEKDLKQEKFQDVVINKLSKYKDRINAYINELESIDISQEESDKLIDIVIKLEAYIKTVEFEKEPELVRYVSVFWKQIMGFYKSKYQNSDVFKFKQLFAQANALAAGQKAKDENDLQKGKSLLIKLLKNLFFALEIPIAVKENQEKKLEELKVETIRPYTLLMRSIVFSFRLSLIKCIDNRLKNLCATVYGDMNIFHKTDLYNYTEKRSLDSALTKDFYLNSFVDCQTNTYIKQYKPFALPQSPFEFIIDKAFDAIKPLLNKGDMANDIKFLNRYFAFLDYLLFFFFLPYVIDSTRIAEGVNFVKMWEQFWLKTIYSNNMLGVFSLEKFKNLVMNVWNKYSQAQLTVESYNASIELYKASLKSHKPSPAEPYYNILEYINDFQGNSNVPLFKNRVYVYGSGFSSIEWIGGDMLLKLDKGDYKKPAPPVKVKPKSDVSIVPVAIALAVLNVY